MVVCLLLNLGFKAAFEFKCKVVVVDCDDICVRWHSIPSQINPGGNTMDLTAYARLVVTEYWLSSRKLHSAEVFRTVEIWIIQVDHGP